MNKAWIAFPMAAVALAGCQSSDPEPVAQVPPPAYSTAPEPLPPVSINQGATVPAEPSPALGGDPEAYDRSNFQPEPLPPAEPAPRTYTIRKGDTFWAIAKREYGTGQKWRDISAANPSVDPKKLAVGQKITLP
ncbi:MAG: LysM peptidoglycan-binding domain-containing protein [Phycisphaeraceae bacterium]